jgi:adenosine deaminase
MTIATFLQAIPKVELHLQLEGALPTRSLRLIADQNDISESLKHFNDWVHLLDQPDYKRLPDLIRVTSAWIQHPQDLTRLVYDLATMLSKQNVRYAEVGITPALYTELSVSIESFFNAVNDGRDRAKRAWGIDMAWVLTIPRDEPRRADDMARWVTTAAAKRASVVALAVSGREDVQPVGQFERAFRSVEKKEVARVARAGDVYGAEGVARTIESLAPSRLLDAWGAVESPEILTELRDKGIVVALSLIRSLRHGWVSSLADHPLRRLYSEGVSLVLGTDMPTFYHTTLADEYQAAIDGAGFTLEEVENLALNAVRASYMPDDEKTTLLQEFAGEFARLREEHVASQTTA